MSGKLTDIGQLMKTVSSSFAGEMGTAYSNAYTAAVDSASTDDELLRAVLVKMPHPSEYCDPLVFAKDYALYNLLRKLEFEGDKVRLHQEAIHRFESVEAQCKRVNDYLLSGPLASGVESVISHARHKISRILGSFDLDEFVRGCEWGPGATSSLTARESTLDNKILERRLSVTLPARAFAKLWLESAPAWFGARIQQEIVGPYSVLQGEFELTPGGRFTTVPKDVSKRRGIDIQPTLNLFLQKGVGKMLRRRLRRIGIDLDDQGRNQRLAELAFSQGLATLDLENASDSVTTELVRTLLPREWFEVMDRLRTRVIEIEPGRFVPLQKFSAMGNGFTFELESLIFFALAYAVVRCEGDDRDTPIAVYGDDIIVGRCHAEALSKTLEDCGFVINRSKSFVDGPFFESCGKHFFKGCDVTPPYQKGWSTAPWDLVRFFNRIARWENRIRSWEPDFDGSSVTLAILATATELSHDMFLSRSAPHGAVRKGEAPIPVPRQPVGLEGDYGLIDPEFDFGKVSENGFCKIWAYVTTPKRVQGRSEGLYAWALRPRRECERVLSGGEPEFQRFERWRTELVEGQPSYGFVTPRGVNSNRLKRVRLNAKCLWVLPS